MTERCVAKWAHRGDMLAATRFGMRRYDVDSIDNRDRKAIERTLKVLEPVLERFFSPVIRGLDRVPSGPGLYVANHNGGVLFPDTYVLGAALYRHGGLEDLPYALAHDMAVRTPIANQILVPLGGVRASPANAHKLFEAGRKVLVYPGGDVEALRPFKDRDKIVFGERRGYLRLAIEEGVPLIPVVTAGAHAGLMVLDDGGRIARWLGIDRLLRVKVCPVVLSVPWGLTIGFPPPYVPVPTRMFMEVLEPIELDRAGPEAANDREYVERCHRRVVGTMQASLTRLARERAVDKRARQLSTLDRVVDWVGLSPEQRDAIEELAVRAHVMPGREVERLAWTTVPPVDEREREVELDELESGEHVIGVGAESAVARV
ncbi:1-acyl-sn-glycerol-3-phosphate acyltransferase [Sandaracinus amylolyticus]|uniref:1-acyl-sn-glycerol-3-phosphate acyltransferase n=1 Tax=Sandaracinus amylolyticus TaxID=927083 RepID=UPI001F1DFD37|nr:1-acyl-sn-glycerol-3-phosphate acyltransferase [Sandaracinus amylolyticus]